MEICSLPCEEDGIDFDINAITTEEISENKAYTGIRVSLVAYWTRFLKKIKQDNDLSFETVMSLIVSRLKPIYETLNRVNYSNSNN